MFVCFAGGLLVAPLCGEPVLSSLTEDPLRLLIASVLWYLMFYCPQDLFYTLTVKQAAKIPLYLMKGLYYPKKIVAGLKHAKHVYKNNLLAGIIIAIVKTNGSGVIKPFSRLARGKWRADEFESMKPSVTTKYCIISAVLYALVPTDLVYIIIAGLLLTMKVGPLFGLPVDPFTKAESILAPKLFGEHAAIGKKLN